MLHFLGAASLLLILHTEYTQAVCGTPPVVWRNSNITCPERAVCADVFEIVRDWYNGTSCRETRILSNCMCPGDTVCPTSDPSHLLFSTRQHKQFICRPVCQVPWCNNIERSPRVQRPSARVSGRRPGSNDPIAMTTVQDAVEFGYRNYNQIGCRCQRHHFPIVSRGRSRAVKAVRYEYNYSLRRYSTLYTCNNNRGDANRADPCPPRDPSDQ